ncbi:MAG: UDP-2,3-diacylglucosamine diphosphatase [Alistipes sp.]|nr:UDP-2,3-diacylglucosamine diphosphatase [Alistipes sp.]
MYYFASDLHLGLTVGTTANERESLFTHWLEARAEDAEAIFLVGDVFDFWFEYRRVVPRGFVRVLGKLAELTDRGVKIHFFPGNHDLWSFDYLQQECGVQIHAAQYEILNLYGHDILIGHGDALGPRPWQGRLLSWAFRNAVVQRGFATLCHPNTALRFGQWWSGSNRQAKPIKHPFRGDQEPMVQFARTFIEEKPEVQLFVCGHIHCAEIFPLDPSHRIAFLGEWIDTPTYGALYPNGQFELRSYPEEKSLLIR